MMSINKFFKFYDHWSMIKIKNKKIKKITRLKKTKTLQSPVKDVTNSFSQQTFIWKAVETEYFFKKSGYFHFLNTILYFMLNI